MNEYGSFVSLWLVALCGFLIFYIGCLGFEHEKITTTCPEYCFPNDDCSFYNMWVNKFSSSRHEGYISGPCQCEHVNSDGSIHSSCADYLKETVYDLMYLNLVLVGFVLFTLCVCMLDFQNLRAFQSRRDVHL